jgi:hypothetical protein
MASELWPRTRGKDLPTLSLVATDTGLAGSGRDHDGIDLTEDDVDAAGDSRHNRARRNRDKPSHQSVLDKILTATVFPDPKTLYNLNYVEHDV